MNKSEKNNCSKNNKICLKVRFFVRKKEINIKSFCIKKKNNRIKLHPDINYNKTSFYLFYTLFIIPLLLFVLAKLILW